MTQAEKLRDLSDVELETQHKNLLKDLFCLKNEIKRAKKAEKPHLLPSTRKEIARVLTIKRQRQIAGNI